MLFAVNSVESTLSAHSIDKEEGSTAFGLAEFGYWVSGKAIFAFTNSVYCHLLERTDIAVAVRVNKFSFLAFLFAHTSHIIASWRTDTLISLPLLVSRASSAITVNVVPFTFDALS